MAEPTLIYSLASAYLNASPKSKIGHLAYFSFTGMRYLSHCCPFSNRHFGITTKRTGPLSTGSLKIFFALFIKGASLGSFNLKCNLPCEFLPDSI